MPGGTGFVSPAGADTTARAGKRSPGGNTPHQVVPPTVAFPLVTVTVTAVSVAWAATGASASRSAAATHCISAGRSVPARGRAA